MRRRASHLLCPLLAALLAAPAAGLPRPKERWLRLDSAGFTFFSNVGERRTREIAAGLEHLRAALRQLAGGEAERRRRRTFIYVFRNDVAFRPYKLLYDGKPAEVAGFFAGHEHGNYVAIDGDPKADPELIVYHEYLHEFLRDHFPAIPLWLNEGMAELYSNFEVAGERAKIGLPRYDHLATLRRHGLLPLDELLAMDRSSPGYNEGLRQGIFYAQTWLLAHYLLLGSDERAGQTRTYLASLAAEVPPPDAFARSFGSDLAALEQELERYARTYKLGYLELPLSGEVDLRASASELSHAEVLFRLGDLLAHLGPERAASARQHLEAALTLEPEHAGALTTLGYLEDEAGNRRRALELYRRAAALAPDDPFVQRVYGLSLILSLGDDLTPRSASDADRRTLEAARAALARSTALDPADAAAWAGLGFTYTFDLEPSAAAVAALERAWQLMPGSIDVAFNLVLVHSRLGHRAEAEAILARLGALGADPATLERARQALLQLDVREVNALLAAGRLADAVPKIQAVVARTDDPELRLELAAVLKSVEQNLGHNDFVRRYNEAARLTSRGDYDGAIAILEALVEDLEDGPDRDDALYLLEEARTLRAAAQRP
ncbi:MAG: hypothetical protein D6696_08010 [Acidobacteria bacterium]|nr:MAG: hypothetical protein D6696_08010 [Acidobacteriota bacterium]